LEGLKCNIVQNVESVFQPVTGFAIIAAPP